MSVTDSERRAVPMRQVAKPLPPLPRGWSRVCHETGLFLRGIGLGIVVTSVQGVFAKNFSEPEKVAIRQSRVTALLRTLIHAVPVGVAVFEVVFNLKGHFVGEHFDKQNYLQFAAKAHEITMQASIATILLSYIRYQITGTGSGMPFGAVLGGLQFLQVSYLWSMEFWSSISTEKFQPSKKTCFTILILVCIAVAATAGPSSATLLIPRQGLWPLTSTYLAVNASVQDIWPDRLDDDKVVRDCAIFRLDSNATLHCPLLDIYSVFQADPSLFSSFSGITLLVHRTGSDFVRDLMILRCQFFRDQICATIPQSELLDGFYLAQLNQSELRNVEAYQFMQKNYYQPYTVARCVADSIRDASDQTPLQFARISEAAGSEVKEDREIVLVPSLTKGNFIHNLSENSSDFHVDWVDLPTDVFRTGVPGVVIVAPSSQDLNGSSYDVFTCTLNAGWGSSAVGSSSATSGDLSSHISNIPSFWPVYKSNIDKRGYLFSNLFNFANFSSFVFPQRRISASKNWMETLNPTVVLSDNSTRKYIPLVLSSLQSTKPTETNVAEILTSLLATAMAETGIGYDWKVFSDFESATRTCETCLIFEIEYSFFGWLYSDNGTTTRLALAVMLAYCVLVLGHIIYSAISGVSSTAWDSVAELAALGMNSSPTKMLQNTCAGIIGRQAFKTPVRVLVTTPGHLELVFGEAKDPNATSELVMNQKYGRLDEKDGAHEVLDSDVQGRLRHRAAAQSSA